MKRSTENSSNSYLQTNAVKEKLAQSDKILEKIMSTIDEPKIKSTHDVFFDLMSCILEQQIHYRSTKKSFQKMLDKAGLSTLTLDNFSQFEDQAFVGIKLSASKYETLSNVLSFFKTNNINWQLLTDEEVRLKLASIKGIGQWTIDMLLLYTLQRPNVFPCDDFHLKQIMVNLYNLNPNVKLKAQLLAIASHWGENKSLAVSYLLAWKTYNKGL